MGFNSSELIVKKRTPEEILGAAFEEMPGNFLVVSWVESREEYLKDYQKRSLEECLEE